MEKSPTSGRDVRRSKTALLKLPFVKLFHSSTPQRSIELSVKTLNVMARAQCRHSTKIKMVNGYPFHLDYTM